MAVKDKPKLSNEELIVLAKNGDEDAKDELFRWNTRLCGHIAQKFKNVDDVEELIAIGNVGLIKAYNTFDLTKGFKFATYATRLIQNEILMYFRKEKKHNIVTSYDMVISTDDDGSELHLLDRLAAPEDNPLRDELENLNTIMEKFKEDCKADRRFGKRDLQIVDLIYFKKKTQYDIAKEMGLSQSYISRLEGRIVLKLKKIAKQLEDGTMATKKQKGLKAFKENFVYLYEKYEGIIPKAEMERILNIKTNVIYYYIKEYNEGKMKDIKPNSNIEDKVAQKFKDKYDNMINKSRAKVEPAKSIEKKEVLKTDKPAKIVDAKFDDREHFEKKEAAINKLNYTEEKKENLSNTAMDILNKQYTTLEVLPLLNEKYAGKTPGYMQELTKESDGSIFFGNEIVKLDSNFMNKRWMLHRRALQTYDAMGMIINDGKELLFIEKDGTQYTVDKNTPITLSKINEGLFYEK